MQPDVAFVDVGLPGLDGYQLARRIRAAPRGHRFFLVALTGNGGPEARSRAKEAGFDMHVTKPIDFDELSRIVARSHVIDG